MSVNPVKFNMPDFSSGVSPERDENVPEKKTLPALGLSALGLFQIADAGPACQNFSEQTPADFIKGSEKEIKTLQKKINTLRNEIDLYQRNESDSTFPIWGRRDARVRRVNAISELAEKLALAWLFSRNKGELRANFLSAAISNLRDARDTRALDIQQRFYYPVGADRWITRRIN